MNELRIFESSEFGLIRTNELNGKVYFCGLDVCNALGYSNSRKALNDHCKGVTKRYIHTNGGSQEMSFISEGDLYRLVASSKLASAEKFEKWVFDEVLPSIRKNGGYINNQENLTPEQVVANALIVAQNILSQKDKQIEEMTPKAEFFDAVTGSKDCIEMKDVAKLLNNGMGRNKLFEILRNKGILDRNNRPYQKYVDAGSFREIETTYHVNGETKISLKTVVFQKGVSFISKLVNKEVANG